MRKKRRNLLAAILVLSLGVIFVVILGIGLNQPDAPQKTIGLTSTPEQQIVYPPPWTSVAVQAVYPEPGAEVVFPTQTARPEKSGTSPKVEQGELTIENVPRTLLKDAKAAFDGKKAVFVDVRTKASYDRNHVPGAVSIPEAEISQRMNELDSSQWIITYCS